MMCVMNEKFDLASGNTTKLHVALLNIMENTEWLIWDNNAQIENKKYILSA